MLGPEDVGFVGSTLTPNNLPFYGLIQRNQIREPQKSRLFGVQVRV